MPMYLIFDTETTNTKRWIPITDTENWPDIQIAWQLHDSWVLGRTADYLFNQMVLIFLLMQKYGISTDLAAEKGVDLSVMMENFQKHYKKQNLLLGKM